MIPRRLRSLVLVVLSLSLFTIFLTRRLDVLRQSFGPSRRYQSVAKVQATNFLWNDVPVQHPLKKLRSLPEGVPRVAPGVQYDFGTETASAKKNRLERRQAVKNSFVRCYNSYRERAWLKDELKPVSGQSRDTFGGWAATLVDSLDTLAIMDMEDELYEAIEAVSSIDFSNSSSSVINIFETNIRYLGGFLAAYDLTGSPVLLEKAIEVGEMLLVPFDTPNHMPVSYWHWHSVKTGAEQTAAEDMVVAQLGSFSMEFTRLSQITGDMRWYDAAARITDCFYAQRAKTQLPGMWPISINAKNMDLTIGNIFTLGGMADSLYEYFPKMHALLGGLESVYQELYEISMDACIKYLFFRPMVPASLDILISGNVHAYTGKDLILDPEGQHLGCFAGGMLALGGKLLGLPQHVDTGLKLTEGCIWAYNASINGIMPETFHVVACEDSRHCTWSQSAWEAAVLKEYASGDTDKDAQDIIDQQRLQPGFLAYGDRSYILRPEAIESVFILYRITGNRYLQDAAWDMFVAIQTLTESEFGNSALADVTVEAKLLSHKDEMESFWMAETLKYFYLIFSEPELISLDRYVFNTEAHPFLLPR